MKQSRTSTFRGLTCGVSLLCWAVAVLPAWGETTILHNFDQSGGDGFDPYGTVTLVGNALYGMTWRGGNFDQGVIYKLNTDDSGYDLLYEFAGGSDGALPHGVLTSGGGKLYGTAWGGGDSGNGVVFQINTDGTGYTNLHEFTGGSNGAHPYSSLALDGDWLYGMTNVGGSNNVGVLFRTKTDGSIYDKLYDFGDMPNDGMNPRYTRPIVQDGKLYGVTQFGGTSNGGVLFTANTDGSGYDVLHHFAGGAADGGLPGGDLVLSDGYLYGATGSGGDANRGVVYRIDANGVGYTHLHEFAGGNADGWEPVGGLTLVADTLYGTTNKGGDDDVGVAFKIGTDGAGYDCFQEFAGGPDDGSNPFGWLVVGDSVLYGTTRSGGAYGNGVIFTVVPEPATLVLLVVGGLAVVRRRRK